MAFVKAVITNLEFTLDISLLEVEGYPWQIES